MAGAALAAVGAAADAAATATDPAATASETDRFSPVSSVCAAPELSGSMTAGVGAMPAKRLAVSDLCSASGVVLEISVFCSALRDRIGGELSAEPLVSTAFDDDDSGGADALSTAGGVAVTGAVDG